MTCLLSSFLFCREWFRTYKTFDSKPLNKFALDEKAMNREYTLGVISQTHGFWKSLVARSRADPSSVELAIGSVPVPSSCFAPPKVESEKVILTEALEEMVEHVNHKRQEEFASEDSEDSELEHDSKRVELVSVNV